MGKRMDWPNEQSRFAAKLIFDNPRVSSVMDIGYRRDSLPTIFQLCRSRGIHHAVLEVHPPNCRWARNSGHIVFEGDVRNVSTLCAGRTFSVVQWLHGPEHILLPEFDRIEQALKDLATEHVLLQAPIGSWAQEDYQDNEFERHVSEMYPADFLSRGWKVCVHNFNGEATFSAIWPKTEKARQLTDSMCRERWE